MELKVTRAFGNFLRHNAMSSDHVSSGTGPDGQELMPTWTITSFRSGAVGGDWSQVWRSLTVIPVTPKTKNSDDEDEEQNTQTAERQARERWRRKPAAGGSSQRRPGPRKSKAGRGVPGETVEERYHYPKAGSSHREHRDHDHSEETDPHYKRPDGQTALKRAKDWHGCLL
ncbi:uncharacterized protein LOC143285922 [Babylonia areolata]|uniref:uncharacterized protein LOC143285922 n=1 Tax=Babylonia areolata TaxID=304850 RepID=UPI003FD1F614